MGEESGEEGIVYYGSSSPVVRKKSMWKGVHVTVRRLVLKLNWKVKRRNGSPNKENFKKFRRGGEKQAH